MVAFNGPIGAVDAGRGYSGKEVLEKKRWDCTENELATREFTQS